MCLVLKNFMCYHIICLSAILKPSELIFLEKAKNVSIGKNRRRGGPRNTESALNKQNGESDYTELSGTSTSSNSENL